MSDIKRFYSFVLPSIGAMLVTGLYFIVDGVFIGQGVGADALGMVNLSVPFISILTSVAMMITMGGASVASICFGRGERARANNVFNLCVWMVLLFALFMAVIAVLFGTPICRFLGASDHLLAGTVDYLTYYTVFGVFFSSAMLLSAFIRNDGNPRLAFWGMIIGALSNIILDWVFIFPLQMGVKGAAIASGLGQVFSCAVLLSHFVRKKGVLHFAMPHHERGLCARILKVGLPEFVTHMSQPVTTFCYNMMIVQVFGEIGISAFSVASYLLWVVLYIFMGLAQGVQPLLSLSFGEGEAQKERFFLRAALQLGAVVSVVIYAVLFVWGEAIISIFDNSASLIALTHDCLRIYGLSFAFAVWNMIFTTYYLSTERTKNAMLITVLRSLVLNTLCIFLLPALFGSGAIWFGIVVAEGLMALFVLVLVLHLRTKACAAC